MSIVASTPSASGTLPWVIESASGRSDLGQVTRLIDSRTRIIRDRRSALRRQRLKQRRHRRSRIVRDRRSALRRQRLKTTTSGGAGSSGIVGAPSAVSVSRKEDIGGFGSSDNVGRPSAVSVSSNEAIAGPSGEDHNLIREINRQGIVTVVTTGTGRHWFPPEQEQAPTADPPVVHAQG